MAWECAECNVRETEDVRIDVVCHHCGKLLCGRDRVSIIDDAFSKKDGFITRAAFHCRDCKKKYHPWDATEPSEE
jgi:hypothetical protein